MRPTIVVVGLLLVLLGVVALCFQGVTFFTQERVLDAGPLKVDVSRPHTIILNPIAGVVALVAGAALIFAGRRPGRA
jgi:hypothetical protein